MTVRIAQISDTHIGESRPVFNGNFECLAETLQADRPDLVINTGDLSLDGADHEADLRRALAMHEAVGLPWRAIPGNHDIGDSEGIGSAQPIDGTRRRRYLDVFGEDWWSHDVPGWRLVAINAQLAGSSLAEAQAQAMFVREAVASAAGRAVALFVHKPLFDRSAGETVVGGRFLPPVARAELMRCLEGGDLRLVASGHVHQARETGAAGVRHIWAPSTACVLPEFMQPTYGRKVVGYVEHRLHADGSFDIRLVEEPAGMVRHDLVDVPEAYGDVRALKR
jgi:Icc protein